MGNKQGILNYSDEIKIFSTVCDIKFLSVHRVFCHVFANGRLLLGIFISVKFL